jgi:hypothetical protein
MGWGRSTKAERVFILLQGPDHGFPHTVCVLFPPLGAGNSLMWALLCQALSCARQSPAAPSMGSQIRDVPLVKHHAVTLSQQLSVPEMAPGKGRSKREPAGRPDPSETAISARSAIVLEDAQILQKAIVQLKYAWARARGREATAAAEALELAVVKAETRRRDHQLGTAASQASMLCVSGRHEKVSHALHALPCCRQTGWPMSTSCSNCHLAQQMHWHGLPGKQNSILRRCGERFSPC